MLLFFLFFCVSITSSFSGENDRDLDLAPPRPASLQLCFSYPFFQQRVQKVIPLKTQKKLETVRSFGYSSIDKAKRGGFFGKKTQTHRISKIFYTPPKKSFNITLNQKKGWFLAPVAFFRGTAF